MQLAKHLHGRLFSSDVVRKKYYHSVLQYVSTTMPYAYVLHNGDFRTISMVTFEDRKNCSLSLNLEWNNRSGVQDSNGTGCDVCS